MPVALGLDRLLDAADELAGRSYGLLCHQASLDRRFELAHLALQRRGRGADVLFGPEHGFYGVEQDMVAAHESRDPWTGAPIVSLYGDDEGSLRPRSEAFDGLDLLVIDLQDVGTRYYTFAATAVWSAEVAIERGCEVWILDRPNPLGGARVEGNLPEPGLESFVSAFALPVRHGLTLGELCRLEARRRDWPQEALRVWPLDGWRRGDLWCDLGRPWVAPSPNMPTFETAVIYPGGCLIEATELSEGRGTTRPFLLYGHPEIDPPRLRAALASRLGPGLGAVPSYFRPQFQKHAGKLCGGVELVVDDPRAASGLRFGVQLLACVHELLGEHFRWREQPYEFVADIPAIDLLAGTTRVREALEGSYDLEDWIASWAGDEARFRDEREAILLYRQ